MELDTYRKVITAQIEAQSHVRGYKTLLAKAARCQKSYLTQCLAGKVQFTEDHGFGLCRFWALGALESEYFLNLIRIDRARDRSFAQFLKSKNQELKERHLRFSEHLSEPPKLSREETRKYYLAWFYPAIHIITGIKRCQSAAEIAKALRLPLSLVEQVLKDLAAMQLVERVVEKSGEKVIERWLIRASDIHFGPEDSNLNHAVWRSKTALDLQDPSNDRGLHYSGVHSMSRADYQLLSSLFLKSIKHARTVIGPSKEEDLYCLSFDFYSLLE